MFVRSGQGGQRVRARLPALVAAARGYEGSTKDYYYHASAADDITTASLGTIAAAHITHALQ